MEFSDIALAKLLQSAPDLGRLIVTFKDVTEELPEESDTQVGIFILRSGSEVYYAPVISKAGNVFPIDSVYQVSISKFIPLTKKVIDNILNAQSTRIGKATKIPSTVTQNPSVYELINPPRTGKFVYASSSRLTEFLASLPNDFKAQVMSKVLEDKEVYSKLHKIFGLEDILRSLQATPAATKAVESTSTYSVVTGGNDLGQSEVASILSNGYAIRGDGGNTRIAINAEDFSRMGKVQTISNVDAGKDYTIIFNSSSSRVGYVPKTQKIAAGDKRKSTPVIFENGDYAISNSIVISGEGCSGKGVIKGLFEFNPPIMVKDLENRGPFALFNSYMELLGIYSPRGNVTLTSDGAELKATDMQTGESVNIRAYRNFRQDSLEDGGDLFIPYISIVIPLRSNVSYDLEVSVNSAQKRRSITELTTLGSSMDVNYDGVEFSINGQPVGGAHNVAQILVIKEGVRPEAAESFIKQAKEKSRVKIYLSKKADFSPGEIPQFGENGPEQVDNFGAGKDGFVPSIKSSLETNDDQVIEATIISELLQTPDMYEQISEYLPDIEEAVDKLGRVLLLSRLNLDKLSKSKDAEGLFAFLASLKNVYKNLGDTMIKLRQLVANVPAAK